MNTRGIGVVGLLTGLLWSSVAWGQDADVSVTHGINGSDLGLAEALPVDVAVDDVCLAPLGDLTFGEVRGPLPLPAPGTYNVKVFLDDGDCGGALVIDRDLSVLFGQTVNIVAHLNNSGQPTATAFNTNLSPLGAGNARVELHHGAAAGEVDVILRPRGQTLAEGGLRIENLANNDQRVADVPAGAYRVRVRDAITNETLVGPVTLRAREGGVFSVFAVGSAANESLGAVVIPSEIP